MGIEFKMISDLAAKLQHDAEQRKRDKEFSEKLNADTAYGTP
jgi:hypothetical protein